MWIISPTCGLLSIVIADGQGPINRPQDLLMVRARNRDHLALLRSRHPALASVEIIRSSPELDYPWRMLVDRATLSVVLAQMIEDLDWRNVKAEAHRNEASVGSEFVHAMSEVHATLARRGIIREQESE